jgi:hypothetical protein
MIQTPGGGNAMFWKYLVFCVQVEGNQVETGQACPCMANPWVSHEYVPLNYVLRKPMNITDNRSLTV